MLRYLPSLPLSLSLSRSSSFVLSSKSGKELVSNPVHSVTMIPLISFYMSGASYFFLFFGSGYLLLSPGSIVSCWIQFFLQYRFSYCHHVFCSSRRYFIFIVTFDTIFIFCIYCNRFSSLVFCYCLLLCSYQLFVLVAIWRHYFHWGAFYISVPHLIVAFLTVLDAPLP